MVRRTSVVFLRETAIALFYLLLSVLMTWPLVRFLGRAVSDPGDPLLNAWILHWDYHATWTSANLFNANIFYPAELTLAFSENIYGIAMLLFPLRFAGVDALTAYNVAMIGGFGFAGYGAHVLARTCLRETGSRGWIVELISLPAGVFFAFVPYRFDQLSHLQHIWTGWLPLHLAAVILCIRRPGWPSALLVASSFFLNGLTNIHWLLFMMIAAPLFAIVWWSSSRPSSSLKPVALWMMSGWIVGGLAILPILLPYRAVSERYGFERGVGETTHFSAQPADWARPPRMSRVWGDGKWKQHPERRLFPGLVAIGLAAAGLFWRRRAALSSVEGSVPAPQRWVKRLDRTIAVLGIICVGSLVHGFEREIASFSTIRFDALPRTLLYTALFTRLWLKIPFRQEGLREFLIRIGVAPAVTASVLLVVVAVMLSIGLNGAFHSFLYVVLDPYRALRVPARWAMMAYLGMSVLIAFGCLKLLENQRRSVMAAALVVSSALLMWESHAAPINWRMVDDHGAVYGWLRDAPISGAILELPMTTERKYDYVYRSTVHNKPLVNGVSGFETSEHAALQYAFGMDDPPAFLVERLAQIGVSTIVVHDDDFDTAPGLRRWLSENVERKALRFVDNFAHRRGGDYVFAVNENEPEMSRLVEDEVDETGRSRDERLEVLISGVGRNYVPQTFGELNYPFERAVVSGPLLIQGWTLSPDDVARVRFLFERETVAVEAERSDDPSLRSLYPWYSSSESPLFTTRIDQRPAGVSTSTDLIVEVTDGEGRTTHLPQRRFIWHMRGPSPELSSLNPIPVQGLLERLGFGSVSFAELEDTEVLVSLIERRVDEQSAVADEDFVALAYQILLERSPSSPEIDEQVQRLRFHYPRMSLIEQIVESKEFLAKYRR